MSLYSDAVMEDSPAGYWRLGELTGATAFDESFNGVDGTYVGDITLGATGALADGLGDTGISIAGYDTADYVSIPNVPYVDGPLTWEWWFNPNGSINSFDQRGGLDSDGQNRHMFTETAGNWKITASVRISSVFYTAESNARSSKADAWYHFVSVWDKAGGTLRIYVNGEEEGIVSSIPNAIPDLLGDGLYTLEINRRDGANAVGGKIDEVAVYNAVLSADRIREHYQIGVHNAILHPVTESGSIALGTETVDVTSKEWSILTVT